jgi:hypothetical protein
MALEKGQYERGAGYNFLAEKPDRLKRRELGLRKFCPSQPDIQQLRNNMNIDKDFSSIL